MSKPKERERQISALKEEIESLYDEESRLDDEIM
jgi:transcription factor E2F3